jgi:hypothetical protein
VEEESYPPHTRKTIQRRIKTFTLESSERASFLWNLWMWF